MTGHNIIRKVPMRRIHGPFNTLSHPPRAPLLSQYTWSLRPAANVKWRTSLSVPAKNASTSSKTFLSQQQPFSAIPSGTNAEGALPDSRITPTPGKIEAVISAESTCSRGSQVHASVRPLSASKKRSSEESSLNDAHLPKESLRAVEPMEPDPAKGHAKIRNRSISKDTAHIASISTEGARRAQSYTKDLVSSLGSCPLVPTPKPARSSSISSATTSTSSVQSTSSLHSTTSHGSMSSQTSVSSRMSSLLESEQSKPDTVSRFPPYPFPSLSRRSRETSKSNSLLRPGSPAPIATHNPAGNGTIYCQNIPSRSSASSCRSSTPLHVIEPDMGSHNGSHKSSPLQPIYVVSRTSRPHLSQDSESQHSKSSSAAVPQKRKECSQSSKPSPQQPSQLLSRMSPIGSLPVRHPSSCLGQGSDSNAKQPALPSHTSSQAHISSGRRNRGRPEASHVSTSVPDQWPEPKVSRRKGLDSARPTQPSCQTPVIVTLHAELDANGEARRRNVSAKQSIRLPTPKSTKLTSTSLPQSLPTPNNAQISSTRSNAIPTSAEPPVSTRNFSTVSWYKLQSDTTHLTTRKVTRAELAKNEY
ncbi:hypothetical protein PHLCEN_2v4982 [Hermanssonia centrifuga]|uniref:Uncharacterized protein n=1 Tax=Hermanssonia centrifuga TaxID=98765 RepID=A0A2R6PCQ1_9APHY|nr:hypothetical protein PHLCEN_2v4982 [Hermanssonia centrifuga]